jgi:hypothetical protein
MNRAAVPPHKQLERRFVPVADKPLQEIGIRGARTMCRHGQPMNVSDNSL